MTPGVPTIDPTLACAKPVLKRYILQDEQMSVYAQTNEVASVTEGYEYDPYGRALVYMPATVGGTVGFTAADNIHDGDWASFHHLYTGRNYDAESGLSYYRSRYLDSHLGRFISKDTIGVWGDSPSLGNGYAYGSNSPNFATDALGTAIARALTYVGLSQHNLPNVRVELFLHDAVVGTWGGLAKGFLGDDRGFRSAPSDDFRVAIDLNFRQGTATMTVHPSCHAGGECVDARDWDDNDFDVTETDGHWSLHAGAQDSALSPLESIAGPAIDFEMSVNVQASCFQFIGFWEGSPSVQVFVEGSSVLEGKEGWLFHLYGDAYPFSYDCKSGGKWW